MTKQTIVRKERLFIKIVNKKKRGREKQEDPMLRAAELMMVVVFQSCHGND